jgi:hypothetical protein
MKALSGISCSNISDNSLTIEFPPRQALPNPQSAPPADEELVLKVTLTFAEDDRSRLRLSDIKVFFLAMFL